MAKILGLDLGANSIGWSVIDDIQKSIIRSGVRIFPAGLNGFDTNKEEPKNATRRGARQLRRQIFRKKMRKQLLLKLLIDNGMVPLSHNELLSWKRDDVFPSNVAFSAWIALSPYQLRKDALSRLITPEELGRIFYHMIQRRGFLSNRKSRGDEEGKIFDGNAADGKIGIKDTRAAVAEFNTLGEMLASLDPHRERLRNRYTERSMYVEEFEAIWNAQLRFGHRLSDDLKARIGGRTKDEYKIDGVLFHQRPLRSQKHLLGKCTFEPSKTRCIRDSLLFEEFRVTQTVNHMEVNNERLDEDQRLKVIDLLLSKDKPKFKEVRKLLGLTGPGYHSNWQDDDVLPGAKITASLRSIFGERWGKMTEKEREDIWHVIYTADDDNWLTEYATEQWLLDEKSIAKLLKIHIKQDYGSLSKKAIRNILPFLRDGYLYNQAVLLGGLRNALGAQKWDGLDDKEVIIDTVLSFTHRSGDGTIKDQLADFCRQHFGMSEKDTKKLYHHSIVTDQLEVQDRLGEPPLARNPLVMTALYDLRRVVNELLREFGRFDRIHVELARDLKKTSEERSKIKSDIAKREREHIEIEKKLQSLGIRATYENRLRYKLFDELRIKCCPYTGKGIHLGDRGDGLYLFGGQVQIEHIAPWSRSLNGSYFNLTLCDADLNREKANKTPYEFFFEQMGEDAWNMAKNRAKDVLPYDKFKAFTRKEFDDDFTSRQLNDTRYASRLAKDFLKQICHEVYVFPGGATAEMRHLWGLNSVLSDENQKNRMDHRHHAIDAIAIAALNAGHLKQLARWNRYQKSFEMTPVEAPWDGFREQAIHSVSNILVSYRKIDRVLTRRKGKIKKNGKWYQTDGWAARGFLHMETIFGKRTPPGSNAPKFLVRKPIDAITNSNQVEKIVDPVIQRIVHDRLRELGVDISTKKYDVPEGAFFIMAKNGAKIPTLFKISHDGRKIPIKKVRIEENYSNAVARNREATQWVNPQNNHHVAIYRNHDGKLIEEVVTFWDATQRRLHGSYIFQRTHESGAQLVTTLLINDLFLLGLPEDILIETLTPELIRRNLYRVQNRSSCDYLFRLATESTLKRKEAGYFVRIKSLRAFQSYNPIKVEISPAGKLIKSI